MQNEDRNFKGQDLRGRSFKGQELAGADFSDCDLRGVDFSFANLTDAKFCNARMGITKKALYNLRFGHSLIVAIALFIVIVGNLFIFSLAEEVWALKTETAQAFFVFIFNILLVTVLVRASTKNYWQDTVAMLCAFIAVLAGVAFGFIVGIVFGGIALTIIGILVGIEFTGISLVFLFLFSGISSFVFSNLLSGFHPVKAITLSVVGLVYVAASIYLGKRVVSKEEIQQLSMLRNWSLEQHCLLNCTQFAFANLNQADFTGTDLKYTRFKNAKISNCNFHQTQNHHLALTYGTPLALSITHN